MVVVPVDVVASPLVVVPVAVVVPVMVTVIAAVPVVADGVGAGVGERLEPSVVSVAAGAKPLSDRPWAATNGSSAKINTFTHARFMAQTTVVELAGKSVLSKLA
jgi:hypothetical protein